MTRRETLVSILLGIVGVAAVPATALAPELFPAHKHAIFIGSGVVVLLSFGGVLAIAFWPKARRSKPVNKRAIAASWITLGVDVKNGMASYNPELPKDIDEGLAYLRNRFEARLRKAYSEMMSLGVDPPHYPLAFDDHVSFLHWWITLKEEGHKLLDAERAEDASKA